MKIRVLIIIGAIIATGIIILALKLFSKKESAIIFDTVKVERGDITNTVTATGTIEAITTVEVGTQVSGIIEHIYVDFNDNVKQGQILARLDETSLMAQVEQNQASVDMAQAQLNYQEATYNRLKALYEKNLIAQADYDQALFNYENSKASLSNSKSALDRAKVQLAYATIYSPIDGVVLNRAVEEGQTVAASFNTPEIFTIAKDLTQMEVQTSVDEADIGQVKNGQRVEFTVDAYPDRKFEGSVSQVRFKPVTTNNVVTYTVILSAPNPDKKLMPGMTASATIYVEEKNDVLLLTGKAIRFTPDQAYMQKMFAKMKTGGNMPQMSAEGSMPAGGQMPQMTSDQMPDGIQDMKNNDPKTKTVWVKDEKMGIRRNRITIGIDNGTDVEVVSGLKEGDEVITGTGDTGTKTSTNRNNNRPSGPFPMGG